MANEDEFVNTTLCLGSYNESNTTVPTSSRGRNRKKQRKLLDLGKSPLSLLSQPTKSKLQPGCLIHIDKRTELYNMFAMAKWEPVLYYPNRKVFPNMVSEFYSNLEVKHGVQEVMFLTSVVNGKYFVLDHIELTNALKLNLKVLNHANLDINTDFVFNKMEMKLYLSVLCGIEMPLSLELTEKGISYEHFTPTFQTLALILRANIFLNTSGDKLMSFQEIKLMYKLASHKVTFSLPFMILSHMVHCHKKGIYAYGLLLTKVFEHFKLNLNQLPYFQVASTTDKATRVTIPLNGYSTHVPNPMPSVPNLPSDIQCASAVPNAPVVSLDTIPRAEFDNAIKILDEKYEELEKLFQELQISFKDLVEKHENIESKLNEVLSILGSTIVRAGVIEEGLAHVINVQLSILNSSTFNVPSLPALLENGEPREVVELSEVRVGGDVEMEEDSAIPPRDEPMNGVL